MYRLLIVTRNPQVEEMFASMDGWEAMGYKQPRLRRTTEDAVACMHKHHIDAIAVDAGYPDLEAYLDENAPVMPIFQIGQTAEEQLAIIRELSLLLNQLHTDDSNDDYDETYYFQLAREHWMRHLISGLAPTRQSILSHLRLFRCKDEPEQPCIYATLSMTDDDHFLSGRWHYGSDRLETALRNFFGTEHDHFAVHVAVVSPEQVSIVLSPQQGQTGSPLTAEQAEGYLKEVSEQVENYLGLTLSLNELQRMDGLTAFAAER